MSWARLCDAFTHRSTCPRNLHVPNWCENPHPLFLWLKFCSLYCYTTKLLKFTSFGRFLKSATLWHWNPPHSLLRVVKVSWLSLFIEAYYKPATLTLEALIHHTLSPCGTLTSGADRVVDLAVTYMYVVHDITWYIVFNKNHLVQSNFTLLLYKKESMVFVST